MANINNLIVYQEARELIQLIKPITANVGFGDLGNQIRRVTISVVSNICEGAGSGSDKQFSRYPGPTFRLKMARASVNEAQGQLQVLADIGAISQGHQAIAQADLLGRRLSAFIKRLEE